MQIDDSPIWSYDPSAEVRTMHRSRSVCAPMGKRGEEYYGGSAEYPCCMVRKAQGMVCVLILLFLVAVLRYDLVTQGTREKVKAGYSTLLD